MVILGDTEVVVTGRAWPPGSVPTDPSWTGPFPIPSTRPKVLKSSPRSSQGGEQLVSDLCTQRSQIQVFTSVPLGPAVQRIQLTSHQNGQCPGDGG